MVRWESDDRLGAPSMDTGQELVRLVDEFAHHTFDKCLIFGVKSQEILFFFCELIVSGVDDLLLTRLRQEVEVYVN